MRSLSLYIHREKPGAANFDSAQFLYKRVISCKQVHFHSTQKT